MTTMYKFNGKRVSRSAIASMQYGDIELEACDFAMRLKKVKYHETDFCGGILEIIKY